MKKFYLWIALFMAIFSVNAQITVSGTPTTNLYLPVGTLSTHFQTYSQQIYYPNEIKAAGTITGLTFHGTPTWVIGTNADKWRVSLGHTTKAEFGGMAETDIITTGLTQVFDGTVSVVNGELTVTFDTAFNYNGTDNLVVVVDEYVNAANNGGGYTASSQVFATTGVYPSIARNLNTSGIASRTRQAAKCIITFQGITASCAAPDNLNMSNVTAETAKINWNAPTTLPSDGYEYIVSTSSAYPSLSASPTGTVANTETSVNIGGLSASTDYYVFVRSVCSGTGGYWSDAIAFKTECSTSYATLSEDFSSTTAASTGDGSVPACWQRLLPGTGIARVQAVSGNNLLYLWKTAAYDSPIVVLPILSNIDAGTHQLRFNARASTASSVEDLQIGYVTNVFDQSTFVSLQSISNLTTTNQGFTVKYSGTIPAGARVAIKLIANSFRYVDDIVWEAMPSVTLGNNSTKTNLYLPFGTLSTHYKSYTQQIYTANEINATGDITGLTFYGSAALAVGANANHWKVSLAHTTKSVFAANNATELITSDLVQVFEGTVTPVNGVVQIPLSTTFSYNGSDNLVVVVEEDTNAPNNTGFAGNFYVYDEPNGEYRALYSNANSSGTISYGRQTYKNNITFTGIKVGCAQVTNLGADNTTSSSARIYWTAPSPAPDSGYEYYVTSNADEVLDATTTPTGSTTDTEATVSSLSSNTNYYVYVRSLCSTTTKSTWTSVYTFKTQCGIVSTFTEGFESYTNGNIPDCFAILKATGGTASNQVSTIAASAHTGTKGYLLALSANTAQNVLILPQVDNIDAGTQSLKFYWKSVTASASAVNLEIGYMTDITDMSTFTTIKTVDVTANSGTSWAEATTKYESTSIPSNARIAVRLTGTAASKTFYMDDFEWGNSSTLNVSDVALGKAVAAYPNPVKDILNINTGAKVSQVEIYNLAGGKILDIKSQDLSAVNVSKLAKGNYIVVITLAGGERVTKKIIKE